MKISNIVILAGGMGTRSENPDLAKPLQSLSEKQLVIEFLITQLEEFPDAQVIWVLGNLADQLIPFISANPKWRYAIDKQLGTTEALREISETLLPGNSLVLLGDVVCGAPLRSITDSLPEDSSVRFFGRQTSHFLDSDLIEIDGSHEVMAFYRKGKDLKSIQGVLFGLSGVTVIPEAIMTSLCEIEDAQEAIYETAVLLGVRINFSVNSWYLRDVGTPDRIKAARGQIASGAFIRRAARFRPGIFIDRDGTLIPNQGEGRDEITDQDIPRNVVNAIRRVNDSGVPIFMITNQPGIAKGFITENKVLGTMRQVANILHSGGAFLDDFRFCPHHPEAGWPGEVASLKVNCLCRKPLPEMVNSLAKAHLIDLESSWVIGDSLADELLSKNAGMGFQPVSWDHTGVEVETAISKVLKELQVASF